VLTIVGFIYFAETRIIVAFLMTTVAIYLLHYYHEKERETIESKKRDLILTDDNIEGFENPAMVYLQENNLPIPDNMFQSPDSSNPFSNVLMTDYDYNPHKQPAPPAFNNKVNNDILSQAKQMVQELNPDQPDIADKLFKDLGEQFVFEQSLRPFHSTANSTIPNDQGAFAEFCYGSMISCKEGNEFACARNLASRHTQ